MNGLDSPIEINLVPLLSSTINNLWTLVAILTATAAFSLWRLRSVPLSLPSPQLPPTKTHMQLPQTTSLDEEEEKEKEKYIILTSCNRSNSSKELYTVFYDNEVEENEDEDVDGGDEEVVISAWRDDDDDDEEESTVEIRGAGDLGWYGYQDRRVINGSVVRLWQERSISPRRYRRAKRSLTF